jgi:HD superfamily phosphohydrolase
VTSPLFNALAIPEVAQLDSRISLIRIPPELDVPLTARVRKIIDATEFRRLAEIPQLGLVSLVYPGARHTRFEHSLGVYRLSLLFLRRLSNDPRFAQTVRLEDVTVLIAAALLHDIGHWPCCHLIEDLELPGIRNHESMAERFIARGKIGTILRREWNIDPDDVLTLLEKTPVKRRRGESENEYQRRSKVYRLFMSIISGPIDIDKMDYLVRDSLGCGVPYGHHFDQERLIGCLCLNEAGDGLAISEKGRTAAELMVFARYVMFSEVYWHHTVRAATVMFQRAFEILWSHYPTREALVETALETSFEGWLQMLRRSCETSLQNASLPEEARLDCADALRLLGGIFSAKRSIYKRVRQFSVMESPEIYAILAGRPYPVLRQFTGYMVDEIRRNKGNITLRKNDILVDSPPKTKEIEFKISVFYPVENKYRPLHDVSPVVRALADEQFEHNVKKIRIFARAEIAETLRQIPNLDELIRHAATKVVS